MRKPVVAANWKLHKTVGEAVAFVGHVKRDARAWVHAVDVVICAPFTALKSVAVALEGASIGLGAQDMYWEDQGAFTGEISGPLLIDAGCQYVIIGHSERRAYFGETDETVQRKVKAALQHGLMPIVCIGETLAQREANQTFEVLARQLTALSACASTDFARLVLAYEPVWAIGTGRNATPEQAQASHRFIRQSLSERHGAQVAEAVRIQYGGSVNAANAASLMQQPDVDGALVGGASLKVESFAAIVKAAAEAKMVVR